MLIRHTHGGGVFFILSQIKLTVFFGSRHGAGKRRSQSRITLQTFRLTYRATIPAARCLGVIPHFKGLAGKDYQQLPFSLELLINQTAHFRAPF